MPSDRPPSARKTIRGLRWYIVAILFLATTVNYVDRITVASLKPILQREIGWDEAGYGWLNFAFQLAYAIMFPIAGRLLDRFGVRTVMIWAVVVWSFAAMGHSLATTALGFAIARFVLGIGEAANFPACVKAVAEWFPKKERAFATGIFNTGTNVGAMMIGPVALLAAFAGWRAAFLLIGACGLLWLGLWLAFYRAPGEHNRLSDAEREYIALDRPAAVPKQHIPWPVLLRYRQAWAVFVGKLFTDPVWWFYLYWLPPYLSSQHALTADKFALLITWPYIMADVGSIAGGWFSSRLIKSGMPVGKARLLTMGLVAMALPLSIFSVKAGNVYLSLAFISLATCCHQAWSANLFTIATDMFPERAVGSVVGFASMSGAIGGLIMTLVAGGMLQWLGSYVPLFIAAGVMHPLAWAAIRLLSGKAMTPANLDNGLRTQAHAGLFVGGAGLTLIGVVGGALVATHWADVLAATRGSVSAAASGIGASILLAFIGCALVFASRPVRLAR
ncbi:MAG: MFS transporter [Deltaproteobacteria bacterium]|nr:MFS transporter [Deltaproteobacteria bacterium]